MPERYRYERTPDSLAVLIACALAGIVVLITGVHPPSMVATTGYASAVVWALVFTAASLIALLGLLWPAPVGWAIELAGRVPLAATAAGYVLALLDYTTSLGAVIVVAIIAAVAVASLARAIALAVRIVRFRSALLDRGRR